MKDGDYGDDSRFTDVQMLKEFRCADHGCAWCTVLYLSLHYELVHSVPVLITTEA